MLKFKLNGKTYQVERAPLESLLVSQLKKKMDEGEAQLGAMAGVVKSAVKGAIVLLFKAIRINPPQDRNTLDFAMEHIVTMTMDALEKQTIELHAEELALDE